MQANRLVDEKSPYLLQHAHNPVAWFPWGEEAFEKARREDKPIFLSIGYSTCHWCHVMERESFENTDIAELMNRWFVSIKVDREERPDIDRIYMTYVQATTGSGGWPMSVWLTPDLHPFVGGTYFPPDNQYGRPGFPLLLERIAEAWKNDRDRILESSRSVMDQLREAGGSSVKGHDRIDPTVMDSAFQQFRRSFDTKLGGFGDAPKFPRPSVHNFLLRYWKRTGNEEALDMVVATLIAMEKGGMNDQLGGGFHRYSVDSYWFVPHFEKMLYDQAQLVSSYIEAFQITGNPVLAAAARRTLDYVLRDMTSLEGGFYSAEDADSAPDSHSLEKREGAFYVWSLEETLSLLGEPRANWFAFRYGMEPEGNVSNDPRGEFTRRNILFQAHTVEQTARQFDRAAQEMESELNICERILFEARARRPRPHLDDKILTAWNGLMISAFSRAGVVLERDDYVSAGGRAASMILGKLCDSEGQLIRRYRDGSAAIPGMLDDYAFFIQGLLDLYEATGDFARLEAAISLAEKQSALFEDRESGGFFASSHEDASRLMRVKDDYDGAEPSGNSISLMNLLRLHQATGREEFLVSARNLFSNFQQRLASAPFGMPQMLCAAEFDLAPPREIVIAGELDPKMSNLLWREFDPNRVVLHASPQLARLQPQVAEMRGPAVYLCQNFACQAPAHNAEDLAPLLK
jgi:uncharacterized protein YyaL (SSP411 family)